LLVVVCQWLNGLTAELEQILSQKGYKNRHGQLHTFFYHRRPTVTPVSFHA
jgi:hypothetical protein